MLEVILNDTGESLDVTGGITYVFQSAEIGQIAQINSDWSWKINFPRSPKNQKNLDGLGLLNFQSNKPYESISVLIRYNSINIVDNGKLIITETTSENYTGH